MSRPRRRPRSEEHTSELQSRSDLVCRLLLEKKKNNATTPAVLTSLKQQCRMFAMPCARFAELPFSLPLPFFFNDSATTEIYTLSLHDALPISRPSPRPLSVRWYSTRTGCSPMTRDRKSTRLNSSDGQISYAVFCWKQKRK